MTALLTHSGFAGPASRRPAALAAFLLLFLPPTVVLCQPSPAAETTATTTPPIVAVDAPSLLRMIESLRRKTPAVTGQFAQVRSSPLQADDVCTTGRFYVLCPGRFRCDMKIATVGQASSPLEAVYWVEGSRSRLYIAEIGQISEHVWDAGDEAVPRMNYLQFFFEADPDSILKHYDVKRVPSPSGARLSLRLEPWYTTPLGGLEFLQVDFAGLSLYPARIQFKEEGEEGEHTTSIRVWNVRAAGPVDDAFQDLFRPSFPEAEKFRD